MPIAAEAVARLATSAAAVVIVVALKVAAVATTMFMVMMVIRYDDNNDDENDDDIAELERQVQSAGKEFQGSQPSGVVLAKSPKGS